MSQIKSSLGNVSPRSKSARYKEMQIRYEKISIETVKKKIQRWPRKLQEYFEDIENDIQEDNEMLKILEVLVELKKVLEEEVGDFQVYIAEIEEVTDYLHQNIRNLEGEFLKNYNQRHIYEPEGAHITNSSRNIPINSSFWNYVFGLFLFLVCIPIWLNFQTKVENVEPNKIEEWTQNIKDLQEKFPSQNEKVWFSIMSGVKTIVTEKPTKPSVLLLLHNDKKTSACLANKVGKEAVKLLSDTLQEPITISGEDLKLNESLTKDYGLFTESYKHDIEKKHVMIVLDLQEVPGEVARTFHVLCDVENPLVRSAAFLFTMLVDEKQNQQPTKIAEDYLSKLWENSLPNDIMDPLITRMTDAVVSIKMESHLPC